MKIIPYTCVNINFHLRGARTSLYQIYNKYGERHTQTYTHRQRETKINTFTLRAQQHSRRRDPIMKNYKDIYKFHQEQSNAVNAKKKLSAPNAALGKAKSPLSSLIYKQINLNMENMQYPKQKVHSVMPNNQNSSSNSHYQVPYNKSHKNSVQDANIIQKIIKRQQQQPFS